MPSYTPYRIYNIGNNQPVNLMDFISVLEKTIGKEAKKEFMDLQPGDVIETFADIDDLSMDVGFKPNTPLGEGIRKFVSWYKDYHNIE